MKSKEKMVDEDDWDVKNERNGNAEKRKQRNWKERKTHWQKRKKEKE